MQRGSFLKSSLILSAVLLISAHIEASQSCTRSLKMFLGAHAEVAQSPTGTVEVSAKLLRPQGKLLRALSNEPKEKLHYIVDPENRVYFVKEALDFNSEKMMIVQHTTESGEVLQIPVKEGGRIEYDQQKKVFRFLPEYEPMDLSEEEISLIRQSGEESGEVITHSHEGVAKAKMMDCQKIYEAQRSGKSFIWDQFLTNNSLLTLSIATQKPGRFTDTANYDMLLMDYATGNEHTAIRSFSSRYIMMNNLGYGKRLATRVGVGLGSTQIQGWTSKFIVKDKDGQSSSDRADKVTKFNRIWMFPSLVKSDALDKFILKNLPEVAYDLCLKGSPLRIFASPKMIRFAEGWLSSTIYFTLRDKFTGAASPATAPVENASAQSAASSPVGVTGDATRAQDVPASGAQDASESGDAK